MSAIRKLESVTNDFDEAIRKWLSNEVSGHLGTFMYTDDADDHRWKKGHSADNYYLGRDDKATFDLVLKELDVTVTNLIDLGPGGEASVQAKTIPLARRVKSQNYYPVDLSKSLAQNALTQVQSSINISGAPIITNFFEQFPLEKRDALIAFMGGTLGNLETHTDPQVLQSRLIKIFSNFRKHLNGNSHFLVSFDANTNVSEIVSCYSNMEFGNLIRSCIERAIDTRGFDYDVVWRPENYQLATGLRATYDQIIKFNGEEFAIEKDEFLPVLNSYRFPVSFVQNAAIQGGWKHQRTWTATGRVQYQHYST